MPDRGKLVVGSILTVALLLALFAVYWHWKHRHRAAEFWGAETSQLIGGARRAELLVLRSPADGPLSETSDQPPGTQESSDSLLINGQSYAIASTLNVSDAPGLIHARHSLTEDASFRWDTSESDCQSQWRRAIRFTEDDRSTTLAFDFACGRVHSLESGKTVAVLPRIVQGFQRVTERAEAAHQRDLHEIAE
jgi:hypothetical protein